MAILYVTIAGIWREPVMHDIRPYLDELAGLAVPAKYPVNTP